MHLIYILFEHPIKKVLWILYVTNEKFYVLFQTKTNNDWNLAINKINFPFT